MKTDIKRMAYRVGGHMFYDFASAREFALEILGSRIANKFNSLEQYKTHMSLTSTSSEIAPNGKHMTIRATFFTMCRCSHASVRITFVPLQTADNHAQFLDSITRQAIVEELE